MRTLIIAFLFFIPLLLKAQTEGTVIYDQITKLKIELPEEVKNMISNLPTERKVEKELIFDSTQSIYKNSERDGANEDTDVEGGGGGMQFKFKMSEPDNQTYCNHKNKTYTKKQDLLGKTFLIEDKMKKLQWKIGNEKRKILDYICMNASAQLDEETKAVAWFTNSIPVSIGPETYYGLPGLILALEINGDEEIIVAKEVALSSNNFSFEIPTKGKKVNQEEFDQIREEKMEEMGATKGGRGVRVITHTRNND